MLDLHEIPAASVRRQIIAFSQTSEIDLDAQNKDGLKIYGIHWEWKGALKINLYNFWKDYLMFENIIYCLNFFSILFMDLQSNSIQKLISKLKLFLKDKTNVYLYTLKTFKRLYWLFKLLEKG